MCFPWYEELYQTWSPHTLGLHVYCHHHVQQICDIWSEFDKHGSAAGKGQWTRCYCSYQDGISSPRICMLTWFYQEGQTNRSQGCHMPTARPWCCRSCALMRDEGTRAGGPCPPPTGHLEGITWRQHKQTPLAWAIKQYVGYKIT